MGAIFSTKPIKLHKIMTNSNNHDSMLSKKNYYTFYKYITILNR